MALIQLEKFLLPIPTKRYFTISEVSSLCGVKPHVLRYWEQEFTQLRPMKRRGNRRYYQPHEVLVIRKIRELLYDQGFTIVGARNRLQEFVQLDLHKKADNSCLSETPDLKEKNFKLSLVNEISDGFKDFSASQFDVENSLNSNAERLMFDQLRVELIQIRTLLGPLI